jgi:lysylphosphatidylglycerol synthetase-like protein (DUF2156 family)
MKKYLKIILTTLILFTWFYLTTHAVELETWVSFEWIIDWCTWNTCEVNSWTETIKNILWWIIKYTTFIVGLLAVLFVVVNGIMYSMGWMDQSMKEESKKRIMKTLVWIIVLLMSWTILNIIAPWIYR